MLSVIKKLFSNQSRKDYYFIHIPKTAGTSFINTLDTCVDEKKIFPCQLWYEINQEIVDKKSNYNLLRGHFGGGAYKLLANSNPHLLTILRHPQSLSISTYHFIKREKNTAVHDLVTSRDMSLLEFLQEPLTAQKINNRMVRHLSFDLQSDPEAQELFLSKQSIKVVSNWIKTPKKINNQQRLVRAKRIIDECSWFGIQEQFDKSMQLFSFKFNLPPVGASTKLNSHNPKQDIDNQCQSLISEQNNYDLQLYSYAQENFKQQYALMCAELQSSFGLNASDKNIDELLERKFINSNTSKSKDSINYKFSEQLIGSGWHRREISMPEKSSFRWTNCTNSVIYFKVKEQDYDLNIRIINAVSLSHLDDLVLLVNGDSVDYNYDTKDGVVRVLKAFVGKKLIMNNLIKIQFKHQKVLSHHDCFASEDQRSLGIAVNWIKITPCKMEN